MASSSSNMTTEKAKGVLETEPIISKSTRKKGTWMEPVIDLRFSNKLCNCQKWAEVRIVANEAKESLGALYYTCRRRRCGFFRWCYPNTVMWDPSGLPVVPHSGACGFDEDPYELENEINEVESSRSNQKKDVEKMKTNFPCFCIFFWFLGGFVVAFILMAVM